MKKRRVSGRWFTETDVKHFQTGALRTITKIIKSMVNWKREFLHRFISKDFVHRYRTIFLKFNFFSQVFFKDFVDRFGTTYLKNGFLWSCFSKILLIDFRIDTNLKAGFSKRYSRKILFVDTKTSTTKIINLKVH